MRETRGNGFGNLPLAVLTAGQSINGTCEAVFLKPGTSDCEKYEKELEKTGPVWYKLQEDEASLSRNSTWEIVWQSGHNIPLDYPDIVVKYIKMIVNYASDV